MVSLWSFLMLWSLHSMYPNVGSNNVSKVINLTVTENAQSRVELINLKKHLPGGLKDRSHRYEIISGNNKLRNLLQLNSLSGSLFIISSLDREELCQSSENDCHHSIIISFGSLLFEIIFLIVDLNDETPTFSKPEVELHVLEDIRIGYLLDLPVASDLDSPKYGIVSYILKYHSNLPKVQEMFNSHFLLQNIKGANGKYVQPRLKVLRPIDRELVAKYVFKLVAIDSEDKRGYVNVILHIVDVNDNNPHWVGLPYKISLFECTPQREILKLKAIDLDDPGNKNSKLEFKIDSSKIANSIELSRIFYISGNNLVLIDGGLKGRAETTMVVPLKVTDGGGLQNTTDLIIHIKDCNDFPPHISIGTRSAKVMENKKSQEILTYLTVKDEDMEFNCEFRCNLNDTRYLYLREVMSRTVSTNPDKVKKGRIIIYQLETLEKSSFNREEMEFYPILIICIDRGSPSLTSSQQFNIIVEDENDNPPIFERTNYQFEITENSIINAEVGSVFAPDVDTGENSRIKYSLDELGNKFFSINMFGNVVSKHRFDREETNSYTFTVTATDHGNPNNSANATVTVKILDLNDCKPAFKQNYHFNVVESYGKLTINTNLGIIEAFDEDEKMNGMVSYSIGRVSTMTDEADKGTLSFNARITNNGKLSMYGTLDREEHSTVFVDVIAKDHGRPSLSTVTTVTITVLDLNDNKPKFSFPSSSSGTFVNVSYDCEVGYLLAKLEAVDNDNGLNGSLVFQLVGNESMSPVTIEKDGRVFLKESVKLRHHRTLQSERIVIRVSDQSEEGPLFEDGSLILRYIWPTKGYTNSFFVNGKRNNNKFPDKYFVEDQDTKYYNSSYIVVLYGLAAVVFVVFLIVLCILFYFYSVGRGINGISERNHKKKAQNKNTQAANYQNEFLESRPFDVGGEPKICSYQNLNESKPSIYQMENFDANYMQLMSNPINSRCQTYTPINIYSPTFNKSLGSLNIINTYSPQSVQKAAMMTTNLSSPVGSTRRISIEKYNNTNKNKNKSRTLSSILKRKSLSNKDQKSHSLSSIESTTSENPSKPQIINNKFIFSKDIRPISHPKINETYISSTFV